MNLNIIRDAYQATLKYEYKISRKNNYSRRKFHSRGNKQTSSKKIGGEFRERTSFPRGRGRGREYQPRFYMCRKSGHMSRECPYNTPT